MSAVERMPHLIAISYPQLVSVIGLNATSRIRWPRGRVSTKRTASATSSADIIPASSGISGVRPRPSSIAKSVATPPGQTFVHGFPAGAAHGRARA